MPREGTETTLNLLISTLQTMHLMPREGTETIRLPEKGKAMRKCILCPVRGRKRGFFWRISVWYKMHLMPREGTETSRRARCTVWTRNASYAP